jgi:hypothetical protein
MKFTEEEMKKHIEIKKDVMKSCILNKEEDVAFGGNRYLFRVEGDYGSEYIYYIDNLTKKEVIFGTNGCLNLILLSTFNTGKYYDMNNPILLSFLENYSKSKHKLDIGISDEAIKGLNIDTSYTFTKIIQNIEDKKLKLNLLFHCHFLFNNYIIADKPDIEDEKKYEAHFAGEKWDGYFIYYYKTSNKGFINGELFHVCKYYTKTDGTLIEQLKSIKYTGMPNLLDDINNKKKEIIKSNNSHEYKGNDIYKKNKKIYTFRSDGTFTITNDEFSTTETINISKSEYNTLNVNENNLKSSYNNTHTMSNYNSNPYQDRNIYANNTDYKQEFYHKFSDPWKVRNDVEKNGSIVNEFGEVFSKEQVKHYKKCGVEINPDRNIHGDKTTKQFLKRK